MGVNTQDIINILLVIGFLIIVGCFVFITYYLVQALKSISNLANNLEETTQDINNIRNSLKLKALAAVPPLLAGLISTIFKFGKRR